MKCIFAAMPYHFTVQYHARTLVALHADRPWVLNMDGVAVSYRMQECGDADGELDSSCAVFVPSAMGRRDAGRLLAAFNAAHPGVIPPHLVFQFERIHWWERARRNLPARLDYHQLQNDS